MHTVKIDNIRWALDWLYRDAKDPAIKKQLKMAHDLATTFRKDYHGKIHSECLAAEVLHNALQDYEALQRAILKPFLYAQLLFSADSRQSEHTRLFALVRDAWQEIHESTLFFELDILALDEQVFQGLVDDKLLRGYRHYLITTRAHAPYTLNEQVEQVLKRKDLSGKDAFVHLFDEFTASLTYSYKFPGEQEERETTGEELLALIYHPDASVRESSFSAFLDKHAEHALVLTSCFNNILLDHGKEAELRNYPDLMTPTHLSCETEPAIVENMLSVTEQNYPLAQQYFEIKRQLLGYDILKNTDLYAPVVKDARQYHFDEALALVVKAFAGFSPQLAEMVNRLVDSKRIDLAPRSGKTGGAFCMGMYPGVDPYVLLNFTGTIRDVSTLAHELGHAVHYILSGVQNIYHYHATLPLAETSSVFAEMLLTRTLLDVEADRQTRIALLCAKIEEIIATTFRQTVLTRFEQSAHARRGEGLLSPDDYCELWLAENKRLLGPVEMIPSYRWGWSYIGHFIHSRFYCYSYVFGELLVLSLYQKYRQQGDSFVPAYLDLLSAGGSDSPDQLVKPLGIDLHDPDFWGQGYRLLEETIEELQTLLK